METVYLDNNATTQPAPQVVEAVDEMYRHWWGNPSSVHRFGQAARQRVELARASVADLLGCRDREVVLTSGGTESNNLALFGALVQAKRPLLITTPIEHSAIREPGEALSRAGVDVELLPIDADGCVEPSALHELLNRESGDHDVILVSVHWANNETGVVEPIDALVDVVRAARESREASNTRILFHTDATQMVGKAPISVSEVGVDLLTCSAHKFHGPKGVGALFIRQGVQLAPQNRGGPQERDRRGGTENTPAIVGMGVAAELAKAFVDVETNITTCRARRDRFERGVLDAVPDAVVNGGGAERLWNTTNVGFPRLEAEAILIGLSERGVYASAGAACSSGSLDPSPVLLAMGVPEQIAHGSVRFSMSRFTTDDEIDTAVRVVPQVVQRLKQTLPTRV